MVKEAGQNGYIEYSIFTKERGKLKKSIKIIAGILSGLLLVTVSVSVIVIKTKSESYNEDIVNVKGELTETLKETLTENKELEETVTYLSEEADNNEAQIENLTDLAEKYQTKAAGLSSLVNALNAGDNSVKADPENLRIKCNATEEQLNTLLEGTAMQGHGWDFLEAEHSHNVNAIILMSILKQESGLGRHTAASYNAAGIRSGSGWKAFSSFKECINELARLLNEEYLTEGGRFYSGTSITDVNVRYCLGEDGQVNFSWSQSVKSHSAGFVYTLHNQE